MRDVDGKVAFVTGGASGIGYGMARVFLRNGMKVVIADIRQDHLAAAAAELKGANNVHFIRLDVTDRAAMKAAADETERVFGKGAAIYVTAKAAVLGLSESLKAELADDRIGVTVLCPGPIATNIREVAKLRPEKFRDTGLGDIEQSLADRPNAPTWMDPIAVGEMVLDAIRRDLLFVFTHNEFRDGVAQRFQATLAAFSRDAIDAERAKHLGFPTSNPLYAEILAANAEPAKSGGDQG